MGLVLTLETDNDNKNNANVLKKKIKGRVKSELITAGGQIDIYNYLNCPFILFILTLLHNSNVITFHKCNA